MLIRRKEYNIIMPLSPAQNDYLTCAICQFPFCHQRRPISQSCGHTCCSSCLVHLQQCPFDQTPVTLALPENEAILCLIGSDSLPGAGCRRNSCDFLPPPDREYYESALAAVKELAKLLRPGHPQGIYLSRPLIRKLAILIQCQLIDPGSRTKAIRTCRLIGERALSEILIRHQDSHSVGTNLWQAVRTRGCQFLGPAMQEEVLKLVLLALGEDAALSRKVLVMFVVQRLLPHFPHQASKTAIGHVIQLLYRASCFKLTKREGDSSLMQLKPEFTTYESLRREHDTQIVSIALETGLRISPEQWSSLLYGDSSKKAHMQSIIDKLQTPHSFNQSIQELVITLQRIGDPTGLFILRPHLDKLASIDAGFDPAASEFAAEKSLPVVSCNSFEWTASCLESACIITFRLLEFLSKFSNGCLRQTSHQPTGSVFPVSLCEETHRQQTVGMDGALFTGGRHLVSGMQQQQHHHHSHHHQQQQQQESQHAMLQSSMPFRASRFQ